MNTREAVSNKKTGIKKIIKLLLCASFCSSFLGLAFFSVEVKMNVPAMDNTGKISTSGNEVKSFERQEGVVIATKIHGPHQIGLLKQSLCLLTQAYNKRPKYDIVVFTAEELNTEDIQRVKELAFPANVSIVIDNRGLQEEIATLSPISKQKFLARCEKYEGATVLENITWWSKCPGRLAYNWQAEFRSWYIYNHPALMSFKYMMWMDTDAFCTHEWERDPIAFTIKNDLNMFFLNARLTGSSSTICSLSIRDGHFDSVTGANCRNSILDIHGFFHISNLDFYRTDIVMKWAQALIGDCFLCREYDDQIAITVPPAILSPNKSWDMHSHGFILDLFHNATMDGKVRAPYGSFKRWWPEIKGNFTEAGSVCQITEGEDEGQIQALESLRSISSDQKSKEVVSSPAVGDSPTSVGLVTVYCNRPNVTWTETIPSSWKLRVYETCQGYSLKSRGSSPFRNAGREECTGYFQYILDLYENLPEINIFIQDDAFLEPKSGKVQIYHTPFSNLDQLQDASMEYLKETHGFLHYGQDVGRAWPRGGKPILTNGGYTRMYAKEAWESMEFSFQNITNQTRIVARPKACFGVHRDRILAHPKRVYETLQQKILQSSEDEARRRCCALEVMWHVLFGEPLHIPTSSTLDAYLTRVVGKTNQRMPDTAS